MFCHSSITNCILFFLFGPIQSWNLPPGDFFRDFAITHDRTSITIYLPTTDFTLKSIRSNQKSITTILDFADESKSFFSKN